MNPRTPALPTRSANSPTSAVPRSTADQCKQTRGQTACEAEPQRAVQRAVKA
jgi:hypothetical protein